MERQWKLTWKQGLCSRCLGYWGVQGILQVQALGLCGMLGSGV